MILDSLDGEGLGRAGCMLHLLVQYAADLVRLSHSLLRECFNVGLLSRRDWRCLQLPLPIRFNVNLTCSICLLLSTCRWYQNQPLAARRPLGCLQASEASLPLTFLPVLFCALPDKRAAYCHKASKANANQQKLEEIQVVVHGLVPCGHHHQNSLGKM